MSPEWAESHNPLRVSAPAGIGEGVAPTPSQVFAVLGLFPEYHFAIRRRDRNEKGRAIDIEVRRGDGSVAIDICLLRVSADDRPAGVFVFDYYREKAELVRVVSRLADVCGPLVLWHDSGGERSILVRPNGTGDIHDSLGRLS